MQLQTIQDVVVISVKPAPVKELECAICNEIVGSLISVCPGDKHDDHRICDSCINKMTRTNAAIGCVYCGWIPDNTITNTNENPRDRNIIVSTSGASIHPDYNCKDKFTFGLVYLLIGCFVTLFYLIVMSSLFFSYKCIWGGIIGDKSWCRQNGDIITIENAAFGSIATLIIIVFVWTNLTKDKGNNEVSMLVNNSSQISYTKQQRDTNKTN